MQPHTQAQAQALTLKEVREKLRQQWQQESIQQRVPKVLFKPEQKQ